MATRMQQRRGTAAQWISTNSGNGPILNAGEIGFETDTNKFKIGDGTNHWINLDYFIDASSTVNPAFGSSITFEGATANDFETTLAITDPTADRTITFPDASGTVVLADGSGNVTVSGDLTVSGTTTTINSTTINATTGIVFEGTTANEFETTLAVTDPTADRVLTLPDSTGTVATETYVDTAVSGAAFDASLAAGTGIEFNAETDQFDIDSTVTTNDGTQTLTNKTLTSPTVSGLTLSDSSIVIEGSSADAHETTLTVTNPTADRTITFPDETGTVQLRVADVSDTEIGYLNGVTSAIQTQIDAKAPLAGPALTGDATAVNLTVSGNLTVNGTTTNINSTNLVVEDKNIVLGDAASPTDTTADGGGITLKGATDKTFNWVDSTDAWTSSEHINLASGKTLKYNGTDLVAAQSGNSGKYLTTDGTSTSWGTVSGYSAPTLGSTSIASGATVTTIAGLTLTSPTLSGTASISGTGDFLISGDTNVRIVPAAGSNAYVGSLSADNIITTAANTQTLTNKTLTSPTMTAPVLGTPASGTLTNATGLPISGLVASTSAALGLGTIELGHATDTTIARASAGVVTIEGVNIVTTSSTDTLTNKTLTAPTLTGTVTASGDIDLSAAGGPGSLIDELTLLLMGAI
jgi:hypothetical protein